MQPPLNFAEFDAPARHTLNARAYLRGGRGLRNFRGVEIFSGGIEIFPGGVGDFSRGAEIFSGGVEIF